MAKLNERSWGERFFALLSYLGILFLIPLLVKRDNKWIHQHAKQGFIMFLAGFLVWIPLLGWILGVYLFVVWIIVLIKVLTGDSYWKIPIIGDIANKIHI
ncbi:hypothetical protein GOV06_04820 [Candidatus Woesearchaeota archaeon]|nr:hypothetical protein [Candidatus Woesearchaeota archaeon]